MENQVNIFYTRVFAKPRNWASFDLDCVNKANGQKIREHNQTRMQGTSYLPGRAFLAERNDICYPHPKRLFELKYYTRLLVAKNNHIRLSADEHYCGIYTMSHKGYY